MSDTRRFFQAVAAMIECGDCDCLDYCLDEARQMWHDAHTLTGDCHCNDETLVVIVDQWGKVLDCNDAYLCAVGMTRDDLLGQNTFELFTGAAAIRRRRWVEQAFITGEVVCARDPGQLTPVVYETEIIPQGHYASIISRPVREFVHVYQPAGFRTIA